VPTGNRGRPRIVLVDEDKSIINFLRATLEEHFEIVATTDDCREALEIAQRFKPDVIVLEIMLPRHNGIEIAKALARDGSQSAIVFLTNLEDREWIEAAFAAGASGFVFKRFVARDLIVAIENAMIGRTFVSVPDL
jgi:DNA-binding NarL/FixJ family response regulator